MNKRNSSSLQDLPFLFVCFLARRIALYEQLPTEYRHTRTNLEFFE